MTDTKLTAELLDELEALSAEVDRLHGHFEDGGCKSMGVAQQLTYAEEALGAKMAEHRPSLISAARASIESRWERLYEELPDGKLRLSVDEGESYLFAFDTRSGWEYFSDAIIWDAESEAQWCDGSHGWELVDVQWYRPLPSPPEPTNGR